jgi:hypothetical protein
LASLRLQSFLLEEIRQLRVCDDQHVPLFGSGVFNKYVHTVLSLEFAYEPRIPTTSYQTQVWGSRATHQSSLAIPRSLQHLMRALLLHASVAVAIPAGSKNSCSPRAIATSLQRCYNHLLTSTA